MHCHAPRAFHYSGGRINPRFRLTVVVDGGAPQTVPVVGRYVNAGMVVGGGGAHVHRERGAKRRVGYILEKKKETTTLVDLNNINFVPFVFQQKINRGPWWSHLRPNLPTRRALFVRFGRARRHCGMPYTRFQRGPRPPGTKLPPRRGGPGGSSGVWHGS
jgi:hypothetical protein